MGHGHKNNKNLANGGPHGHKNNKNLAEKRKGKKGKKVKKGGKKGKKAKKGGKKLLLAMHMPDGAVQDAGDDVKDESNDEGLPDGAIEHSGDDDHENDESKDKELPSAEMLANG